MPPRRRRPILCLRPKQTKGKDDASELHVGKIPSVRAALQPNFELKKKFLIRKAQSFDKFGIQILIPRYFLAKCIYNIGASSRLGTSRLYIINCVPILNVFAKNMYDTSSISICIQDTQKCNEPFKCKNK